MARLARIVLGVWIVAAGCGDDDAMGAPDAGSDAGPDAGPPPPVDAGFDAGFVFPDAGPPYTGCDLPRVDGGVIGGADAGALEPAGYPPLAGPGGPQTSFAASELLSACAYLNGGEMDRDHHNTVLMLDGYLWMPYAHQAGRGGISVFEFDEPCAPVEVGLGEHEAMRESHTAGVSFMGGRWMVTASLSGIMFWDISDPSAPVMAHDMALPGVTYPDSYMRVVMSTFWQAPYVYVGAADNGVFVVDATDPTAPELVHTHVPTPGMRVGGVHAIGNMLAILSTEGTRTNLVDIGDPRSIRLIPGGTYELTDGTTDRFGRPMPQAAYFGHINGNRTYYARHILGGGLIVFDISDPSAPSFLGSWEAPPIANGGYVFIQHDLAFVGLSNYAAIVDVSNPAMPSMAQRIEMTGDFDTPVPIGNVVVASVDDDAVPGQSTEVQPWAAEPDSRAPAVNMVVPRDGDTHQPLSTRVGITFDEFVDMATVWRGSFRVQRAGTDEPLEGHYSGQEGVVNFWPAHPLDPDTEYEVLIPAGGIRDYSGNPTAATFRSTFRTTPCR